MVEWQEILEPSLLPEGFFKTLSKHTLGSCIERHINGKHPDIELSDIVILGVPEDRNAETLLILNSLFQKGLHSLQKKCQLLFPLETNRKRY